MGPVLLGAAAASVDAWQPTTPAQRVVVTADLANEQRQIRRSSDSAAVPMHLAFFSSPAFRLAVVD